MYKAIIPLKTSHVYSLFGVQYGGDSIPESKIPLMAAFDKLIKDAAVYVEVMEQKGPNDDEGTSRVWLGYWHSPEQYAQWWNSAETSSFWKSLPDDAGVWREVFSLPKSRTQSSATSKCPMGVAHLGEVVPRTDKTGYWGCYRDRIDEMTKTERLSSPLPTVPDRVVKPGQIRKGRVQIERFPDNLCFALEGQDHSPILQAERDFWMEEFDGPVTKWIDDVTRSGKKGGMVNARTCYAPESGMFHGTGRYNRNMQLMFFLDMSYMERIAKTHKGHVDLRANLLKSYGPGGKMEGGNLLLWVEVGVMKGHEIEAEYIGCYDGTGFMAYSSDPAFKNPSAPSLFANARSAIASLVW